MRLLYAYNKHRGGHGGGGDYGPWSTARAARRFGHDVEVYTRSSDDLPKNLIGRIEAGFSVFYEPKSIRRIRQLIDSFRPDVIHIYEIFPLISQWFIPECARRGIPVVCTTIDYRLTCPVVTHYYHGEICDRCSDRGNHWAVLRNCRGNMAESLMVASYNTINRNFGVFRDYIAHFVAPSPFTRTWLIEHLRLDPSRVSVIDPVVETPEVSADPAQGEYVGWAGRLTVEKGVIPFVEASRICGVPFKLAVHKDSRINMDVPKDADIVFTGSPEDLDAFYRGCRVFVFPSVWFETFGLVGAEAMARGIPVVASRIGALGNLVEDGVDGLHFEPGNAADLAEKVMRLWRDPALCRRLGEAGRRKASERWTERGHFDRHTALYERILAGQRSAVC